MVDRILKSQYFYASLLLLCCCGFWASQAFRLDYFLTAVGSSPLHWIHLSLDAEKALVDWPTGTRNLGKSLTINAYPLLYDFFGVDPKNAILIFMGVEIILVTFAFAFFFKAVDPNADLALVAIFAGITALSAFQFMNLARFGYPFYWGLYYGLAAASRIVGIAFALQSRPWPASIALSLSVMIHPIIGGFGVVVAFAIVLAKGFETIRLYIVPGAVWGLVVLLWLVFSFSGETIAGGTIAQSDWYALTELFNRHWYPVNFGVFDLGLAKYHFIPLVSLLVAYFILEIENSQPTLFQKEIRYVIVVLATLTVAGVLFSLLKVSPFLVKLCLHRSSDLLAVFLFVRVAQNLWWMFQNSHFAFRLLAIAALVSPVFSYRIPGIPTAFVLLVTLPSLTSILRNSGALAKISALLAWIVGAVILMVYQMGLGSDAGLDVGNWRGYFNIQGYGQTVIVLGTMAALASIFIPRLTVLLPVLVLVSVVHLNDKRVKGYNEVRFGDFHEMQLWAAANTPANALFMLDPGIAGAWRDQSRRASYGNVNEWLHKAALYDSDAELFKEGLRRFSLLGLEAKDFYTYDSPIRAASDIVKRASVRFSGMDKNWFLAMKQQEGIDYFIFDNKKTDLVNLPFQKAFSNARYTVLKP